jgi:CheY-like chemotaxis protein
MPGMDGWQFLEAYQQLIKDKQITYFIYLSTNSNDMDQWIKARNNPLVENLLLKPFLHRFCAYILKKHFI